MSAPFGVERDIIDLISASEGSREKCYYSIELSSQKTLYNEPYFHETSRAHPDCSESKCLITVVPTWHLQGKALGLRLQAISEQAATHPSPTTTSLPWLLEHRLKEKAGAG